MPGGAERDPLGRVVRVRVQVVVGGQQRRDVDQVLGAGRVAGAGVDRHGMFSFGRVAAMLPHTLPSGRHRRQDLPAPFPAEPKDRRRVVDNSPAHGPRDAAASGRGPSLSAMSHGVGGLTVHRAERADALAAALAELLAEPAADPFASEVVAVPAQGVERWLAQRLSHHLGAAAGRGDGVCAGVTFPSPAAVARRRWWPPRPAPTPRTTPGGRRGWPGRCWR